MGIISSLSFLDISIFIVMFIAFAGYIFVRKNATRSQLSYLVMGRTITLPVFVITLVSTWYSSTIGTVQIAYKNGIYNFFTQGLFWYFSAALFAIFIVKKARKTGAISLPEIFKKIYGNESNRIVSYFTFAKVLPIPYSISMGMLISSLSGLNLSSSIIIGTTIVTLYCLKGGLLNVVKTDLIQFISVYSCLIIVFSLSIYKFGGIDYLTASLPESYFKPEGNNSKTKLAAWFIIALCFTFLSPVFYQRCFAANSDKTAKRGIFISMIFWMISDITTTGIGLYAKAYFLAQSFESSSALVDYSIAILPNGMKGFFCASMFLAAFSVLDSHLFITSSTLLHDISGKTDNKSRNASVICAGFISALSALIFNDDIENAWYVIESAFLASVLIPLLIGFTSIPKLSDKTNTNLMSSVMIICCFWEIFGLSTFVEPIYVGLIISLFGQIILHRNYT